MDNNNPIEDLVGEFTFEDLMKGIFSNPVQPPLSLRLEFIDIMTLQQAQQLLGQFIVFGARKLYNKALHEVTEDEMKQLRRYLNSIGYDVESKKVVIEKVVTDYRPDGTSFERVIPVNKWEYTFTKKLGTDALTAIQKAMASMNRQN